MNIIEVIENIKFDDRGLVPAIVQDIDTQEVLMLAYMDREAVEKTLEERRAYYYSRSRKKLWKKGETSGNIQSVKGFSYDCDADTILLKVKQKGVACHTGSYSCFFNKILSSERKIDVIKEVYNVIEERKNNPMEGSYTNYLLEKGLDKILKKVGEEASEVIIGAKNNDRDELVYEISDLVYHLLVLMVNEGVKVEDIKIELEKRRE